MLGADNKGVMQVDSAGAAALADALSPKMQEGEWIFFGALTQLSLAGKLFWAHPTTGMIFHCPIAAL